MKKLIYNLQVFGYFVLLVLVVFTIYANLEPAPLHTKVPAATMLLVDLPKVEQAELKKIETNIKKLKGVNAAVLNLDSHRLCVMYDKTKISDLKLREIISSDPKHFITEVQLGSGADAGPQCPVPLGWLQSIEDVKYAFNFR